MLRKDPLMRIKAKDALKMPYFTDELETLKAIGDRFKTFEV
jgi:hypothetical protein